MFEIEETVLVKMHASGSDFYKDVFKSSKAKILSKTLDIRGVYWYTVQFIDYTDRYKNWKGDINYKNEHQLQKL